MARRPCATTRNCSSARSHEVFAVLFLDSQHRLLAFEELFRLTATQRNSREVVLRRPAPPRCRRGAGAITNLERQHPAIERRRGPDSAHSKPRGWPWMRVLDHFVVTVHGATSNGRASAGVAPGWFGGTCAAGRAARSCTMRANRAATQTDRHDDDGIPALPPRPAGGHPPMLLHRERERCRTGRCG